MKRAIFLIFITFAFLATYISPAFAQTSVPPSFYCIGDNPQPPCATVAPTGVTPTVFLLPSPSVTSTIVPSGQSTSPSPSIVTPPASASVSPSPSPCPSVQNSSVSTLSKKHKSHANKLEKKHVEGREGLLQQLIQLLLQFLQLLLQKIGIQIPNTTNPCSSPTPSTSQPSPSADISTTISQAPSSGAVPTITTLPTVSPANPGSCTASSNTPGGPDPWGGCWPGTNNTGVPTGTKLTAFTGSCTITANNTVISDKTFTCGIDVIGTNVTIKDSMITGTVHNDGKGTVTIEDSTINGGSDHSEDTGDNNLVIIRDNIYGDQHAVHCNGNCTLEDSWLHDNYNGTALGWHENGFLSNGGSNYTIQHNSVYCVGGCTSDIAFIPDGNQTNATVNKNLFVATPYASYCLYPSSDPPAKPGIVSQMIITDNVFQKGSNGKCATYGPVYGWDKPNNNPGTNGYGNVWSGNEWNDGTTLNP